MIEYMKKTAILFGLLLSALTGKAQTEVIKYTPGITSDGVVYYLPQTELKIAVTATRTTLHPGD
ncbi:MAG: DUF4831 family protein, partial [Bacteroidaceae bacterium]|nr:DUF4831 family protein [Bacteroidaceae bacterium]